MREMRQDYTLTEKNIKILSILRESGALRYSELQKKAEMSPAGLSKILEKMVNESFIERKVYEGKPPSVYYQITDKGLEALKEAEIKFLKEKIEFILKYIAPIEEKRKLVEVLKEFLKE